MKTIEEMTDEEAKQALLKIRWIQMKPIWDSWMADWSLRNIELLSLYEEGGDLG